MDKTVNQKAWFLVLPVFLVVAFSAILPLMTVVNYSMQDTFGNNQFFWNGVGWFKELLDPSTDLGGRFLDSLGRNLFFSAVILAIEVPLGDFFGQGWCRFAQLSWYAQMRLGLFLSKRYDRGRRFGRWLVGVRAPARLRLACFAGIVVAPRPNRPWREKPNAGGERRR